MRYSIRGDGSELNGISMFSQLKRLGTQTAIYGVSTILGRFLNFLLVPFYTNVLAPGEYGIVGYVYSIIAFVTVIYSYGMESAYFKYSSTLEIGTPKQNFSTPFLSLLGSSALISFILAAFSGPVASALALPPDGKIMILLSAGILAFDAIAIIPFAALRMEHKAAAFASIKFTNILINVAFNLILLLKFHMGVMGVFISGFIASAATVLILLPQILKHVVAEFNVPLWKTLLRFGLPYVPAGLSAMATQVIDRPILRALTNDAVVGIYQANYRLGIFMMLIVSMYDYAWRPFFFATAKEQNAKEIFSRVLTYLVLFMSVVGLALTFFIDNIAMMSIFGRHLIGPKYWSGLNIVPIVLFGYAFLGIATNLQAGIYIEKQTRFLPVVTFAGALTNIIVNFALIPTLGMTGAAWATFLAYLAQAIATYIVVQKIYPLRYELGRLMKIALAVIAVLLLYYLVPVQTLTSSTLLHGVWKIGLLLLFALAMYLMNFFEPREIRGLIRFVRKEEKTAIPANGVPSSEIQPTGEMK